MRGKIILGHNLMSPNSPRLGGIGDVGLHITYYQTDRDKGASRKGSRGVDPAQIGAETQGGPGMSLLGGGR